MEHIKQIIIAVIATGTLATILMAIDDIARQRNARRAAEKATRAADMVRRNERIRRERIAAAREQLWRECVREEAPECESKDA